jgi:hypothetical protein
MDAGQFSYLRGASPTRAKLERDNRGEKTFTMVFSNGAVLRIVSDITFSRYDEVEHDMWIEVVPPPIEKEGWVILEEVHENI